MNGIYLIIGGNMGDRVSLLAECAAFIEKKIGKIIQQSALYETAAWGKTDQPSFLNQVLYILTNQSAHEVLKKCLAIEYEMGRIRFQKWESRIIDIDILFYNQDVINEKDLTVPHPHLAQRRFVLEPMHEIAPDFIHPVSKQTINQLLAQCDDSLEVKKFVLDQSF
jgi:2-amino-4-hydroxy-6-hydroxymethyldihydropteridine diphosphokinase